MNKVRFDARYSAQAVQRQIVALGLAMLLAAGNTQAQSIDDVGIAAEVVLEDRYPERRIQFPNGVNSLADVIFATPAGFRPLILDLYLPAGAGSNGTRYPLLVMIHGGGWMAGHTRHSGAFSDWPATLAAIANEGFVVASVEYRLSGEAPFPAAFDDVRTAIRWLRAHADQYGIDRNRALAMGGSAGGQLAALVGTACGDNAYPDAASGETAESACVQGVVAWYGVFDFAAIVPVDGPEEGRSAAGAVGSYLDCEPTHCGSEVVRAASAISFVDPSDPPFLLIHGVDDPVVSVEQSRAMHEKLEKAGVASKLIEIPGVKHSFIGADAATTIDASRKAFDASIEFIKQALGGD